MNWGKSIHSIIIDEWTVMRHETLRNSIRRARLKQAMKLAGLRAARIKRLDDMSYENLLKFEARMHELAKSYAHWAEVLKYYTVM